MCEMCTASGKGERNLYTVYIQSQCMVNWVLYIPICRSTWCVWADTTTYSPTLSLSLCIGAGTRGYVYRYIQQAGGGGDRASCVAGRETASEIERGLWSRLMRICCRPDRKRQPIANLCPTWMSNQLGFSLPGRAADKQLLLDQDGCRARARYATPDSLAVYIRSFFIHTHTSLSFPTTATTTTLKKKKALVFIFRLPSARNQNQAGCARALANKTRARAHAPHFSFWRLGTFFFLSIVIYYVIFCIPILFELFVCAKCGLCQAEIEHSSSSAHRGMRGMRRRRERERGQFRFYCESSI